MLIDGEGIDIVTHFGRDEINVYMTSGARVAKEFGFEIPIKVRLDYEGGENFYSLTQLGNIHVPNVFTVHVKEDPIEIIFDDEIEVEQMNEVEEEEVGQEIEVEEGVAENVQEVGSVEFYHFETNVTEVLASIEKPQVLVYELQFFPIKCYIVLSTNHFHLLCFQFIKTYIGFLSWINPFMITK